LLAVEPDTTRLVVEGGGPLARIWSAEAEARGLVVQQIFAEEWRGLFLLPREQRTGEAAKRVAAQLARNVIEWSGARRPTSLRHDAAEAILIGLWGVLSAGWLRALPPAILRSA
jgi:hypothetical protein